jgi:peptidoglycan hydrolase-like protein with peptidoglycan-binding domain
MGRNSKLTLHQPNGWKLNGWKSWLFARIWLGFAIFSLITANFASPHQALSQTRKNIPPTKAPLPTHTTSGPKNSGTKNSIRPVLNLGSQGTEVIELQAMLKLLAYYSESVSGVYDQNTATAVAKFQKAAGLSPDGIVGNETWGRLLPPAPEVMPSSKAPTNPPVSTGTGTPESFPTPSGSKPNVNATPSATATASPSQPTSGPNSSKPPSEGESSGSEAIALPILRLGMKGPAVSGLQERLRALGFLKGSADGIFGPETQAAVKAAQRSLKLESDGVVGHATWVGLLR